MSRAAEAGAKLARVRGWLKDSGQDAALFSSQPGVAWVTAGREVGGHVRRDAVRAEAGHLHRRLAGGSRRSAGHPAHLMSLAA
jgi:hypothetical protein